MSGLIPIKASSLGCTSVPTPICPLKPSVYPTAASAPLFSRCFCIKWDAFWSKLRALRYSYVSCSRSVKLGLTMMVWEGSDSIVKLWPFPIDLWDRIRLKIIYTWISRSVSPPLIRALLHRLCWSVLPTPPLKDSLDFQTWMTGVLPEACRKLRTMKSVGGFSGKLSAPITKTRLSKSFISLVSKGNKQLAFNSLAH